MTRSRHLLPFLLVLLGCGVDQGPADTDPLATDATPLFGRIIFTSLHPDSQYMNKAAIWTAAPDGSDPRPLIGDRQWPESPTVSPDGRWVAFEDAWKLYRVDAEGAGLTELPLPAGVRGTLPKWSPTGDRILFTYQAGPGGTEQLYTIAPDGSGLTPLTSGDADSWGASWSPDGGSIVFIRQVWDDSANAPIRWVITMNVTTHAETVLIDSTEGFTGTQPSWAPDGSALYFLDVAEVPGSPGFYDWMLGRYTIATGNYDLLGSAKGNRPGTLSPDGSTLLFGTGDLWTSAADGSAPITVVANGRENFEAFWTPAAPTP